MSTQDRELLRRYCASGDADCFAELVARHRDMVYSAAARLLSDAADAEDATQDTFLRLARSASRVRSAVGPWLHRTAVNVAIDALRKDRSRREREREAASMAGADPGEASWEEISAEIDRALDSLSDELREPVVLHYLEGKTQTAIARELGVSRRTVYTRINDGVEELRKQLLEAELVVSAAVLTGLLTAHAVQSAPAAVAAELGKMALAPIHSPAAATGASAATAAKVTGAGAAKALCGVLALCATGVTVHHVAVHQAFRASPKPPSTTIWQAAAEGDIEAVKQHIAAGTDLNAILVADGVPGSGGAPLHIAVLADRGEVAKLLLKGGADPNVKAQDAYGDTPLGWAAGFGRADLAELLIEAGADLHVRNVNGSTPLHTAAFLCHADTVKLLLGSGAHTTARDNLGLTPLEAVAGRWRPELESIYAELRTIVPVDLPRIKASRPEIAALLRAHSSVDNG